VNTHREAFSPISVPVGEFIPTRNLSPLVNTIITGTFKIIISKQYKLVKQDLKLQKPSTLKLNLLFYKRIYIEFIV
jgi:hypothetical protein